MGTVKIILKKVPGVTLAANKARTLFQSYEYRKALARIKKTKEVIIERHTKQPDRKIVVAFIVQYIPAWNKLKPIYDKLIKNSDFEVILLCVPSLLNESRIVNDHCNDNCNDAFDYFISRGYECIDALKDRQWFNLEKAQPDFVFHSRPYNYFMPVQYKSPKISKYALLCNVLYAASLTSNGQNTTLNYDYFKDVYCYFAFDRFESVFYQKRFNAGIKKGIQKCYSYGTTGLEQVLSKKCKLKKSDFKKTVIWTPRWSTDPYIGGSNFFRYKETIVSLIKKYNNVLFIIRPHPLMFGNFIKTGEMTEREVIDFKDYCNNKFNVRLDEEKEYVETFWQSDFLISDVSGIVPEYYVTNKPIIYCKPQINYTYAAYALEMFNHSYVVNDSNELIKAFELLYNDKDSKKINREKSIFEIFGNIQNSSEEIVKVLKSDIKQSVN